MKLYISFKMCLVVIWVEKDTHPWSQGFPLTSKIPNGPEMPETVSIDSNDLKYPKAWGLPKLRLAIADYYNHFYNSRIDHENVMIFAGGRPALVSILMFLKKDIQINIASTEYTPYYDMLKILKKRYHVVNSNEDNTSDLQMKTIKIKTYYRKALSCLAIPVIQQV